MLMNLLDIPDYILEIIFNYHNWNNYIIHILLIHTKITNYILKINMYSSRFDRYNIIKKCMNIERIVMEYDLSDYISNIFYLKNLKYIFLYQLKYVEDFSALYNLKNVEELSLNFLKISDIGFLENYNKLHTLIIKNCYSIIDFSNIKYLNLYKLHIEDTDKIYTIDSINNNITILKLIKTENIYDFNRLEHFTKLRSLNINWSKGIYYKQNNIDLLNFGNLKYLQKLILVGRKDIVDITHISYLNNITSLDLSFTELNDLKCLIPLSNIKKLKLNNCDKLKDINDFKYFKSKDVMEYLAIKWLIVDDISSLLFLTNLKNLDIKWLKGISDNIYLKVINKIKNNGCIIRD